MSEKRQLWAVVSDTEEASMGILSKASELAVQANLECRALFVSNEMSLSDEKRLENAGARTTCHIRSFANSLIFEQPVRDAIVSLAMRDRPDVILFTASVFFASVAPGVAALLGTGITADCTGLEWMKDGRLAQTRPAFGGRRTATITTNTLPVLATIRLGVFLHKKGLSMNEKMHLEKKFVYEAKAISELILPGSPGGKPHNSLREAKLILAGGLGLGSRANFERIYQLAELCGGEVAASRGAVAAGFASCDIQVGQTGMVVRPRLYVAFGISGSVQHLSGILDSETIIAVNIDRDSPIRSVSDYFVPADCNRIIDQIIRSLKGEDNT